MPHGKAFVCIILRTAQRTTRRPQNIVCNILTTVQRPSLMVGGKSRYYNRGHVLTIRRDEDTDQTEKIKTKKNYEQRILCNVDRPGLRRPLVSLLALEGLLVDSSPVAFTFIPDSHIPVDLP